MGKWNLAREGKVRKIYEHERDPKILLVAGDGVSAFDQNLGVSIPGKGRMLTKISKYWFEKTAIMVPNAYSALRFNPENIRDYELIGLDPETVTPMLNLRMLPVEAIVRGYITGSMWESYKLGQREFCGITLPEGLKNGERLQTPIFTPTTKAPPGEHDQNLSYDEMVKHLESVSLLGAADRAKLVRDYSISLYNYAHNRLLEKGIILADTKFEFGINPLTGNIMLGDELFTPDSSRFWLLKDYTIGENQKSLDKQNIRDFVKEHPGETVPKAVLEKTALMYAKITDVVTDTTGARKLI